MQPNTAHWYDDLGGNLVALAGALIALLVAFQPNIGAFKALGVGPAQDVCAKSPACKAVQVEGPRSMFDMQWTVWVQPNPASSQADRLALRDAITQATVRDPAHVSVILGTMPAVAKKKGA